MRSKNVIGVKARRASPKRAKHELVTLNEEEYASTVKKITELSTECENLRAQIKTLEEQYEAGKITAKQHDKQVKQHLLRLFDVNRELLPLKESVQRHDEDREREKVRQKLEVMRAEEKKTSKPRKKQKAAKSAGTKGHSSAKSRKR
ncbi:MAG: hypothetical protein WED05_01610 [Candidatus Atabeyarchaeum deiterrae]